MSNKTSQHILNTSATLLGFCLFVITSFHTSSKAEGSRIDKFTAVVAILLTISCVFSFISLKTQILKLEKLLEKIADILFYASLAGIMIIILLISFNIIK